MFYLAFVDDVTVAFDPILHAREDLTVFSLSISQSESEKAAASVEVVNPGIASLLSIGQRFAIISEQRENGEFVVLFRGSLTGIPTELAGDFATFEFIGEGPATADHVKTLAASLKTGDGYDNLFTDPASDDPVIAIEGRPVSYYVDRRSLVPSVSNVISGSKTINVGDEFFDDSLQISVGEPPLSECSLVVEVEWEQRAIGRVNLAGLIREQLAGSNDIDGLLADVRTITPDDLESTFPGTGSGFDADSGWSFVSHDLSRVAKKQVRVRDWYYSTGRRWCDAWIDVWRYDLDEFYVRYEYRQPRRERLNVKLTSSFQPVLGETARSETLETIVLNDILEDYTTPPWSADAVYTVGQVVRAASKNWRCVVDHQSDDAFRVTRTAPGAAAPTTLWERVFLDASALGDPRRWGFFRTDRGQRAVRHALERVRSHVMKRMRFLTVSVEMPWTSETSEIDTDTNLRIESARLPGGAVIGKVTAYTLNVADGQRTISATIGVSVGTGIPVAHLDSGTGLWGDEAYDSGDYQEEEGEEFVTESGIVYDLTHDDIRTPVNVSFLPSPSYAVDEISVENQIYEQLTKIDVVAMAFPETRQPYEMQGEIENVVQQNPTRLSIKMRRIAPEDMLEVAYTAASEPVDAPRGINLDGSISV